MQDFSKKDIQQEEICFSHRYYSYISGVLSHIHHIPPRTTPLQQPVLNKQVQVRNRLFHAVSCQADILCTVDAGPFKTLSQRILIHATTFTGATSVRFRINDRVFDHSTFAQFQPFYTNLTQHFLEVAS